MSMNRIRWSSFLSSRIFHDEQKCYRLKSLLFFSESADRLLGGDGKFEEIIACSQEIAAATAQLVAASNVRSFEMTNSIDRCFSSGQS